MIRPRREVLKTEQEQIARAARRWPNCARTACRSCSCACRAAANYLAFENAHFPRQRTWDALLAATGAPGIHFEDYPELQGYYLPEWSHMPRPEAERFTAALYRVIERDFWGPGAPARPRPHRRRAAHSSGHALHEGFFTQPRGFLLKPICTSTSFLPQRQRKRATMLASGSSHPPRQCRARNAGVISRDVPAAATGHHDDVVAEMIAQLFDRVPRQHGASLDSRARAPSTQC